MNTVWHVALQPGTTEMQDVILADIVHRPLIKEKSANLISDFTHSEDYAILFPNNEMNAIPYPMNNGLAFVKKCATR